MRLPPKSSRGFAQSADDQGIGRSDLDQPSWTTGVPALMIIPNPWSMMFGATFCPDFISEKLRDGRFFRC